MLIYILLISVLVLCAIVVSATSINTDGKILQKEQYVKKKKIFVYFAVFCLFVFIASLRSNHVGADSFTYSKALIDYRNYDLGHLLLNGVYPYKFEQGYVFLTKICSDITTNYSFLFFVVSLLIYIPIFIYFYIKSDNPYLCLIFFVIAFQYTYTLGLLRQSIAVSICLIASLLIEKNKIIIPVFLVLLAFIFHTTAILFLLIIPVFYLFKVKKYVFSVYLIVFFLEIIFLVFGKNITGFVVGVLPQYSSYVDEVQNASLLGNFNLIFLNIVFFLSYFVIKKREVSSSTIFYISALSLAVIFQCLGYFLPIFGRTVWYFSFFLCVLIPRIVFSLFNHKEAKVIMILIIAIFMIRFITNLSSNNYIYPYKFFWEQ